MGILARLFGAQRIRGTLGILDLSGGTAPEVVAADRAALAGVFSEVNASTRQPPSCGVLFMYCTVEADGRIQGSNLGLREIIRDSGATVVVIATPNPGGHYIAASKRTGYGTANLVMTIDRKGDAFPTFFRELFSDMKKGTSMPMAWVKLAPQSPRAQAGSFPETIFSCEAGQIALS